VFVGVVGSVALDAGHDPHTLACIFIGALVCVFCAHWTCFCSGVFRFKPWALLFFYIYF
jgi:hypothetical protein